VLKIREDFTLERSVRFFERLSANTAIVLSIFFKLGKPVYGKSAEGQYRTLPQILRSHHFLICTDLQQSCVAYLLNCRVCFYSAVNRYEFNRSVTL
jgi:hypothetical protein